MAPSNEDKEGEYNEYKRNTDFIFEDDNNNTNDNNDTLVMTLMQDNKSVIKIQAAGQRNKQRTRHLTIRLWWTQEQVEAGLAKIKWVGTKEMLADLRHIKENRALLT